MLSEGSSNFVKLATYGLLVIAAGAELCQVSSITPTCNRLHQIVLSRDQTTNPCVDLFSYACKNYKLNHDNQVDHQVNLKLIIVMETMYPQPLPRTNSNPSIFDKSYIYYKSCVNERDTNLLRYFELIKPGKDLEWPLLEELQAYRRGETNFVVNEWPAGQFDVFALLGQLQSYGLKNVIIFQQMFQTDSVLSIECVAIDKYSLHESGMMDILMDWGLPEETALKYAEDIMETQEYWHTLYRNYNFVPQHYSISYRRLKEQFPYLSVFLENTFLQKFPDTQRIELYNTRYFEFLLTKQWSAKEAQNLCSYLMLRFLIHLQEDKPNDFSKLECIDDLRSKLDLPVNLLYYEYVYKPDELFYNREIYTYFNKTRHYVMETLLENHLNLSTTVVDELRANMSSISLNIGNLPRNLRMSQVEKFFRNIPALDLYNYYQNHLHLLRHRVLKDLLPFTSQTYSIVNDNVRGRSSIPYYDFAVRQVVLPFGMFQPPVYYRTYDPIFKWSNLGALLADVIIGSLKPIILEHVEEHQLEDCIQKMGSHYTRADRFVAVMGAHVAYKAYANEQRIQLQPDFSNISWKKLFFLNLSQSWCPREHSEWTGDTLRIFQNIMRLESFDWAFRCAVNPYNKCNIF